MTRKHGPWIDVHAHPGRCFLSGLPPTMPLVQQLGSPATHQALLDAVNGEVSALNLATVADLRVIGPSATGGLAAQREFAPGEAEKDHDRQLCGLHQLVAQHDVDLILRPRDIKLLEPGELPGVFLSCEGGDFLDGDVGGVAVAYERGVRSVTLVHYRLNELGDIQTEPPRYSGLSRFGRSVVTEMNRLGMIVDLAHATMDATAAALEESSAPVIISHSHLAGSGASHPRLLSVEHAQLVAETGGLVGAWPSGVVLTSLSEYCDEICRMVDALGADHVAIGTDMDANFRPVLTSYTQFPELARGLSTLGMAPSEIDKILGGNFVRVFEEVADAT